MTSLRTAVAQLGQRRRRHGGRVLAARGLPEDAGVPAGCARNVRGAGIPEWVLDKETTAQRRHPDLPPYAVLDRIVERSIEYGEGVEDLIAEDLDAATVLDILRRIDRAELKRRQTPPGVKISRRAFGTDRQMPFSNAWRAYRRDDAGASDPHRPRLRLEPEAAGRPVDVAAPHAEEHGEATQP